MESGSICGMAYFKRRKSFFQTHVKPVTTEELELAIRLGEAGPSRPLPENPAKLKLDVGNGEFEEYQFSPEHPYIRAIMAIKEHCADDSEKFFSLMARLNALSDILHKSQLEKWVIDCGDHGRVHPAVYDAAATLPLKQDGQFDLGTFCRAVEQLAVEKYPEIRSDR
jgi:hypothetical protein